MESQNNTKIIKPSKQFFIRGGIATGILALILVAQTPWFSKLFSKKNGSGIAVSDATVGDIVGKDSNGNGIADWEERLWGLDPTVATTNGISNKSIIEAKRRTLQNGDQNTGPLNETDRLARELFGLTSALGQGNGLNKEGIGDIAGKLGDGAFKKDTTPRYTIKNIKTTKTTVASLTNYKKQLGLVLNTYSENNDIEIFLKGIEVGNYSEIASLSETTNQYSTMAKKMLSIVAPVGIADYHLQLLNSIDGLSRAFDKMSLLEDNSVIALVGFAEYRELDTKIEIATAKITLYLEQYGII